MPNVAIPTPDSDIESKEWYSFWYNLFQYTRCNFDLRLGGVLDNSVEAVSNSGSSATDLVDFTFEKNQLKNNGDILSFVFNGIYASNANNKQLVLDFGSQTIFDTTALAINGGAWIFEVKIERTGSTTQNIFVKAFYNDLAKTAYVSGTQDLTDNIQIKLTATGVSSGDIESKGFIFNLNPID